LEGGGLMAPPAQNSLEAQARLPPDAHDGAPDDPVDFESSTTGRQQRGGSGVGPSARVFDELAVARRRHRLLPLAGAAAVRGRAREQAPRETGGIAAGV